ncbi:glycoside hydrolase family 25 protein [Lentithecium fluviatile CBS 122367]|uniref:N,O-diacetylmuramidase n=1 Tax=Lentithecium fluviatile CBS 122367 TaxID=1168545 RepID=A0A6G1IMY8_9PLEO|nr:glycoside hydrolase family 25 protein [Lentithecium fluviatile CBS 122367]
MIGLARANIQGISISRHQSFFNFTEAHSMGLQFAYVKATEGTTYTDPKFSAHYSSATDAGFVRGSTHISRPSASAGAAQARFFLSNGGGWNNDSMTLPGLLELGGDCTGKAGKEMVGWIQEFGDTYQVATGRWPVLKADNNWWVECTGNTRAFVSTTYLMLVHWAPSPGTIPGGWGYWTFWQYAESGAWGGNSEVFNGDATALKQLAEG